MTTAISDFELVTTAAATPSSSPSTPAAASTQLGADGVWVRLPSDNVEFFARFWDPPASTTVATLTFVHGIGEHIMRYDKQFHYLASRGIRVFGFDQRGFGRTVHRNSLSVEGTRGSNSMVLGDNQGWDVALADVVRACRFSRLEGKPHFLMGHSMGGLIALCAAVKHRQELQSMAGLILSAPAFRPGFTVPYLKRAAGSFLSRFIGSFNIPTDLDLTGLSRDPAVIADYQNDPFVHGLGSLRTLAALLDEGEAMVTNRDGKLDAYDKSLPLLITFGTKDRLTSCPSGREFFDKVQCDDKKWREWDGLYHELHNEPEKDKVMEEYADWILARV